MINHSNANQQHLSTENYFNLFSINALFYMYDLGIQGLINALILYVRFRYTGAQWMVLDYGWSDGWTIQTIVDLHPRSDTGKPNSSPITASKPMYK